MPDIVKSTSEQTNDILKASLDMSLNHSETVGVEVQERDGGDRLVLYVHVNGMSVLRLVANRECFQRSDPTTIVLLST